MSADPPPRIPQITPEEWTDATPGVFAVMSDWADTSKHHVIRTFAQHPELTRPFLVFNKHLLSTSTLPVRLRQIAILRVAWSRACVYMWSSHLRMSLGLGLTREDFEAVKLGPSAPHWSDLEWTLVQAVDRLCERSEMDDATWAALSEHLDRRQMMDFVFTVGTYALLTMAFNTMRIEREPDLQALAAEYGAP